MPSRLSWRHFFYPSMPCTASALPLRISCLPTARAPKACLVYTNHAFSLLVRPARSNNPAENALGDATSEATNKNLRQRRRLILLFDREPLKRSQPCLPWLLANLPAIETGRPPMIGRDNVPWNALKYLPDTLSNAPFPDDRVSVSSCLVSLILVWWKENNGCFLRSHELSIALKEEKINAQNSRQCHICELRPRKVLSG